MKFDLLVSTILEDVDKQLELYKVTINEGFEKEKKEGLHGWFSRRGADGKRGWIDCKTGGPCGRQKGEKRKGYPACRPTKAMCSASKRKKKGNKRIKWKKMKKKG